MIYILLVLTMVRSCPQFIGGSIVHLTKVVSSTENIRRLSYLLSLQMKILDGVEQVHPDLGGRFIFERTNELSIVANITRHSIHS